MNPSTTGARVLLDELVRLGVREIVLCPGSRSAPQAYAAHDLDASGRARLHVRVDERSAAFLALGLAKESRRPAVVITTSGTAVANLHPAVLEAHHGAVPLLLLTADRPPELRGVGANQATDQPGIFGEHVRLALELETPQDPPRQAAAWRTGAARAWAATTGALGGSGHAGPVHLDLPYRDPLAPDTTSTVRGTRAPLDTPEHLEPSDPVAGRPGGTPWVTLPAPAPVATAGATPLAHDPQTLVVIGELPGAEHRAAALDWAARHGAPVIAEPGPGTHDLVLPHGAQLLAATGWVDAHLPARLLVIGRPTLGRAIPALTRRPGVRVEVVTPGEPGAAGWADATHSAAAVHPFAALIGDDDDRGAAPLRAGGGTRAPRGTAFARTWLEAADRVADALDGAGDLDGPTTARTLHDAVPGESLVLLGSSSVARDLHLGVARPRADVRPVTSRGLAGIDGCVSTAVGLALARTDPTYALLGDLTFLHDANGLLIGPDEPVPDLTIVVVDDDGGSIFDTLEYGADEHAGPMRRLFTTPTGADIEALCAAHGVPATTARTPEDLARLVETPATGVRVVRVPIAAGSRRAAGERTRAAVVAALG
ncbi:2-succinyl-5-enolpyruvyl-6-hydroxy-3-cyclohexene-1-carboxylic-acid synthase [Janibacter cremeus]|uniref:2-succinyl-5-enolpyruvyl-6-hydroxy-3- cyclohexene-1-carboxylic-acid synthase n=1 Tax=Janibacter cremeus TaxID=1285192 RepID=UPI0023F8D362|nr:2-succinyl-5-enolpyruvyl-6-hydroxy-3-cyclohexene-1-carboxylic-acid synthase [Janibacter cremeus]WEV77868.1 2-succinyl-5-enolpyruvyl-6-hydroxy-3-cyclohexene-1-carboxylic-acid synthase [Janibacter cremeus]